MPRTPTAARRPASGHVEFVDVGDAERQREHRREADREGEAVEAAGDGTESLRGERVGRPEHAGADREQAADDGDAAARSRQEHDADEADRRERRVASAASRDEREREGAEELDRHRRAERQPRDRLVEHRLMQATATPKQAMPIHPAFPRPRSDGRAIAMRTTAPTANR